VADSSIDLLSLNRKILLNPKAAGTNELVALLELEKPGLEFLCPMARAIYWMETGQDSRVDANEALGTLWCIDDSEACAAEGDHVVIEEIVNHSVDTELGDQKVSLGFLSLTTMWHESNSWPEYLRIARALDWGHDALEDSRHAIEKLFRLLDTNARGSRRTPMGGERTEKGDGFVAACEYTLTLINQISVEGPTYVDTFDEPDSWRDLSERCLKDDRHAFCWLNYLAPEHAEKLGFIANGEHVSSPSPVCAELDLRELMDSSREPWITPEQIKRSYARGTVTVDPSTEAWIAVGCGFEWDPTDPDSGLDPEEFTDWDEFPDTMGPLLKIEVSRDADQLPAELEGLMPYWEKLGRMR
jgi:hypothetical protein